MTTSLGSNDPAPPSLAPQFRAAYSQRTFQRPTPTSKIPIPILTCLKVHIYSQQYLMLTVVQVPRDRPQRTLITNCPTTTRPTKISPGVMASARRGPLARRRLLTALMLLHATLKSQSLLLLIHPSLPRKSLLCLVIIRNTCQIFNSTTVRLQS